MPRSLMANSLVFAGFLSGILSPSGIAQKKASTPSKIEFRKTGMGEATMDGVHLGITSFTGSYGSKLTVLYDAGFGTPEEARNYLEKQIAKAVKLVDRKKQVDPTGNVVGKRVEILLRLDSGETIPAVLRTDGPRFHEFLSSPRESLLQLEKSYMGEGRRPGPA